MKKLKNKSTFINQQRLRIKSIQQEEFLILTESPKIVEILHYIAVIILFSLLNYLYETIGRCFIMVSMLDLNLLNFNENTLEIEYKNP